MFARILRVLPLGHAGRYLCCDCKPRRVKIEKSQSSCSLVPTIRERAMPDFRRVRSVRSDGERRTRPFFSGRPRSDGYTHFKSEQGHFSGKATTRGVLYALIAAVPGSLIIYYVCHLERAPYTNRLRMIDLSREKELAMGDHAYRTLLGRHQILPEEHPASQLVRKVGARIASAAALGQLAWEFKVLDSDLVNAACLPGGKVVVFRGLLDLFKYDETALAVVLAHEAGHVIARHSAEQLGFSKILLIIELAVNVVVDARFVTRFLFHLAGRLPYSRQLELEADYIGLMVLAKTCRYDLHAAPAVFEKLGRASSSGSHIELLTTHPTSEKRVLALRQALPEARRSAESLCAHVADPFLASYSAITARDR